VPPAGTPHRGQPCSSADCITTTRRTGSCDPSPGADRVSSHDTIRNPGRSYNNDVASLIGGLLPIDFRHRSAWEATTTSGHYDTRPLITHREEPPNGPAFRLFSAAGRLAVSARRVVLHPCTAPARGTGAHPRRHPGHCPTPAAQSRPDADAAARTIRHARGVKDPG